MEFCIRYLKKHNVIIILNSLLVNIICNGNPDVILSLMQIITRELINNLKQQQSELAKDVSLVPLNLEKIKFISGCDSSIINDKYIFSIFVNFTFPELEEIEIVYDYSEIELPYIPGFLAFREIPNLLKTFSKIENQPDLIMVDGNGIIHPRGLGIASHLGVELGIPTIGVAKKLLYGNFTPPGLTKGHYTDIITKTGEVIGYAYRSKDNVNPVFVSPGHLVTLQSSLEIFKMTLKKHKLPEPTRIADKYSKQLKHIVH